MEYTKQELEEMMARNGGSLYLCGTKITSLPEGLTVGGSLDLCGTQITSLPEGLTVGGWLDLCGTKITSLPEGLTVGGDLYLRDTQITSLPEGLTVGGSLYLRDTQITSLPEGLTVGGWLDLRGTKIKDKDKELKKVRSLQDGDYTDKYIYCDSILTHIKSKKKIGRYTFYVGKIKGRNVVTDGEVYAHCSSFKEGVLDIEFKKSKDRGAEQYSNLTLDSVLTFDEAVICYRIITGACRQGTQQFLDGLREKKEKYTVAEIIEATKGQFGNTTFADFIKRNAE